MLNVNQLAQRPQICAFSPRLAHDRPPRLRGKIASMREKFGFSQIFAWKLPFSFVELAEQKAFVR
jgi:hypothetical protein